ncbi:phage baseplate assembly protein V [Saccharothrix sp. Mg75]|uniref:phage baseplate assembly protein V n=1 Tax=Saccharothrix sp. Mg75 TaxID=3445357 RepID=UPI003EEEBEEE
MTEPTRYLGKYRGTVSNNVDPERRGRIQALVPDVYGTSPSTFALPCLPVAGPRMGHYAVPPVGAGVWVEFEQGDKDFPIWTGCWYGSAAELPAAANTGLPTSPNTVLQTTGQHSIVLSDVPGVGITLRTAGGATITVNDGGIVISNGQGASISLVGPTVSINQGALAVT